MPFLQILLLATLAMAGLAALRLVRVLRFGRTPLPDGRGRTLFLVGFVLVPPLVLGGPGALPIYLGVMTMLVIAMWLVAVVLDRLTASRVGQLTRLALVGSEGDPVDSGLTPVTPRLTESMRLVARANDVFPRGVEFARQIDRPTFRDDWDALDAVTTTLERQIADDHRLGLGVAASAASLAGDARSRLTTLRRLASDHDVPWSRAAA
jgi:hypothetical protein